jgi:hypothetical protein
LILTRGKYRLRVSTANNKIIIRIVIASFNVYEVTTFTWKMTEEGETSVMVFLVSDFLRCKVIGNKEKTG